jgi:hypothetical protein
MRLIIYSYTNFNLMGTTKNCFFHFSGREEKQFFL